jgi:hypothetical protein
LSLVAPEKRIKTGEHDLAKIHKQWFNQPAEKKEKLLRHQPVIIKRIQDDYNKLEDLSSERISLAEEALKLVKIVNILDTCATTTDSVLLIVG